MSTTSCEIYYVISLNPWNFSLLESDVIPLMTFGQLADLDFEWHSSACPQWLAFYTWCIFTWTKGSDYMYVADDLTAEDFQIQNWPLWKIRRMRSPLIFIDVVILSLSLVWCTFKHSVKRSAMHSVISPYVWFTNFSTTFLIVYVLIHNCCVLQCVILVWCLMLHCRFYVVQRNMSGQTCEAQKLVHWHTCTCHCSLLCKYICVWHVVPASLILFDVRNGVWNNKLYLWWQSPFIHTIYP